MEEEVYIYEGVEYTREELEAEYGDRVDEAIETYFEVKKKEKPEPAIQKSPVAAQAISQEPTEPSETASEDTEPPKGEPISLELIPPSQAVDEPISREQAAIEAREELGLLTPEIVEEGREANYIAEGVGSIIEKIKYYEDDVKERPDPYAIEDVTITDEGEYIYDEMDVEYGPGVYRQRTPTAGLEGTTWKLPFTDIEMPGYGPQQDTPPTYEEKLKEYVQEARIAFADNEFNFIQNELKKAKPSLDNALRNMTGDESSEMVVTTPEGDLSLNQEGLSVAEFYSDKFQDAFKNEADFQAKAYEDAYMVQRGAGYLSTGTSNLASMLAGFFRPDETNFTMISNAAEIRGIKKAAGLSDTEIDDGVARNIQKGNVPAALYNVVAGVMTNVPQMAVAIGSSYMGAPSVGISILGASAAGGAYADLHDNPNIPFATKVFIASQRGLVEGGLEYAFRGDIELGAQAIRGLTAQGRRELSLQTARKFLKEAKIPLSAGAEESLEEGLAAVNEMFTEGIVQGRLTMDAYDIADAAAIGFGSGFGMGTFNIITKIPSYPGSYKTANARKSLIEKIQKLRKLQADENSSQEEIALAEQAIARAKRDVVALAATDDATVYNKMSDEDVEQVMILNRRIARNLDKLQRTEKKALKQEIKEQINQDFRLKAEIEIRNAQILAAEAAVEELSEQTEETVEEEVVEEAPEVTQEEVVEEEVVPVDERGIPLEETETTVGDVVNRPARLVSIGEETFKTPLEGEVFQDGQRIVFETKDGMQYDLGNVDEISGQRLSDIEAFSLTDFTPSVTPSTATSSSLEGRRATGTIVSFEGNDYRTNSRAIRRNEAGDIVSVRIKSLDAGGPSVDLKGQAAEDAAYLIYLDELQTQEQQNKVDDAIRQEIEQAYAEQESRREAEIAAQEEAARDIEETQVEEDADEVTSPEEVPVGEEATTSEGVRAEDTERTEATEEGQEDKVLSLLDELIEKTSGAGKAMDATLAIPMTLLNGSLRVLKAAYIGGKTISEAIEEAYEWIKSNKGKDDKITKKQFKTYVLNTLGIESERRQSVKDKINRGGTAILDAMPFLANYNPEDPYKGGQLDDIEKAIDTFLEEDGKLFGDGVARQHIEYMESTKKNYGPPAKLMLNAINKYISTVDGMISYIFGRRRGLEKIKNATGYTGKNGFVSMMTKVNSLKNNWLSTVKATLDSLDNSDKNSEAVQRILIASYIEQGILMNAENEEVTEAEVIERVLQDFITGQIGATKDGVNSSLIEARNKAIQAFEGAETLSDVMGVLTSGQKMYLDAVMEANKIAIDEKVKVSNENGRKFRALQNYVHIAIRGKKRDSRDMSVDDLQNDPEAINRVNIFGDDALTEKSSGAQETRVKFREPLEEGQYYDYNFLASQVRSFNATNLAIFTLQSLVKMNDFLRSDFAEDLFGGKDNLAKIRAQISFEFNADQIQSKVNAEFAKTLGVNQGAVRSIIKLFKQWAIMDVMFSKLQPIKQSFVYINTAGHLLREVGVGNTMNILRQNAYIVNQIAKAYGEGRKQTKEIGKAIDYVESLPWFDVIKNSPEVVRDILESLDFVNSTDGAARTPRLAGKVYSKAYNFAAEATIKASDKLAAQVSFLNLYQAYLVKEGLLDMSTLNSNEAINEFWKEQSENPNFEAITFASSLVSKDQNASAAFQRTQAQSDTSVASKIIRNLLFPLMSFKLSKTASIMDDFRTMIARPSKLNAGERKDAALRYVGTTLEVAAFHAFGIYAGSFLRELILSMFGEDEEKERFEEDEKGKYERMWKDLTTRISSDMVPFVNLDPIFHNFAAWGFNYAYYLMKMETDPEFRKMYSGTKTVSGYEIFADSNAEPAKTYEYDKKWYEKLGYTGIAITTAVNAGKLVDAADKGEMRDDYGNIIYLTDQQKKLMAFYATAAALGAGFPMPFSADLNFSSQKGEYNMTRYGYDNQLARDLQNSMSDERKKIAVEDYVEGEMNDLSVKYGDLGIRNLKSTINADIKEFTDRRVLQAVFAAIDASIEGREGEVVNASDGKIDEFLYRLSKRNKSARATANQQYNRLNKLEGEEREKYLNKTIASNFFLYGEGRAADISLILLGYEEQGKEK